MEYLILTAARSGEVLGAQWSEIDLAGKVWTIPPGRMKAGREHRIPLSARALDILAEAPQPKEKVDGYIFPGKVVGSPLAGTAFETLLRRLNRAVTTHGFRSSFRDWAGEATNFAREVAEAALAHSVGDAAERAYRRGDALEKRRKLMDAWARYCEPKTANVVDFAKVAAS
jgi:integrase